MSPLTYSPEANYLSRNNIVHPLSTDVPHGNAEVAAAEVRARNEFQVRSGATLTGGAIKRGK